MKMRDFPHPMLTFLFLLPIGFGLTQAACGGAMASRSRARYAVAHGELPRASEIRIAEFLSDYPEALPNPGPNAAGMTVEGARAAWASESAEPLLVVQTAVRGRDADTRPPLALMLLVDRSGSMAEQDKMTYVRAALHRLVDQLDPQDYVGITTFDDQAELTLRPTPVAEAAQLHRAIDGITPRGATNLSDGLRLAYAQLALDAPNGTLRRVVLLTDAIANVGGTDTYAIATQAQNGDAAGIRLSAIGVGLDYEDENLAMMARLGHGNHYFLDSPQEIERVFEREVQGLVEDVADNVYVTFTPAPGVSVVRVDGVEPEGVEGQHVRASLGRLGAGQHRIALWTLRGVAPEDRGPSVGTFTLDYTDMRNGETARATHAEPVMLAMDATQGTVARNSAVAWMAHDLRAVSELADRGQLTDATLRLDRVRAVMSAMANARPDDTELGRDLAMLDDYARALSSRTGVPVRTFRARVRLSAEGG
ncbi:MAG: VWA domain-containing protein [Sandaracinaceae bacterium]